MNVQETLDTDRSTGDARAFPIGRTGTIVVAAVILALAWAAGALSYDWVAAIEEIDDHRAQDVSLIHGVMLGGFWLVGTILVAVYSRPPATKPDARKRFDRARPSRRFIMATVGFALATLVSAGALLAIASTAAIVVTPPIAWLIVSTFSALGAVVGYRVGR